MIPHSEHKISDFLYDSINLPKGTKLSLCEKFFQKPVGYPNKTQLDTNMQMVGCLPTPEYFRIARILFSFGSNCNLKDVFHIAENYIFKLYVGQKIYWSSSLLVLQGSNNLQSPIKICDFCRSVFCNNSNCPNCGANHFKLHTIDKEADFTVGYRFSIDFPEELKIQLLNQQYFSMNMEGVESYTLVDNLKFFIHFEGVKSLGVV
jgi:hypothetical protein